MNTVALWITAGIFGVLATILAQIAYLMTSIGFGTLSIVLLLVSLFTHRKETSKTTTNSNSGGIRARGVGTDDNTNLVIKAICDESKGFVTFNDIVRDTNLPLKVINKALDWLLINNFATENKLRNGKVYMLTPEGKTVFSQLINEYLHRNKL